MSVSGDKLTTLLPHLTPLTRYEVRIYAQYDKGDSLPLTGYETTLEGIHVHSRHLPLFFKLVHGSRGALTHSHLLQN